MLQARDSELLRVTVAENQGFERSLEYVEFSFQMNRSALGKRELMLVAESSENKERIPCQVTTSSPDHSPELTLVRVIFPVSIEAHSLQEFIIKRVGRVKIPSGKLNLHGKDLGLVIENEFYRADLTKNSSVEPQSYDSGQIRELFIKLGFNQLITNVEDRVHWAPNFDRPEIEWYTTIAHWDKPATYHLEKGPYQIRTVRQDIAPEHPEILLTATYRFYEGLPYFRFYSEIEMKEGVWLTLLRNDEMAMDSMFTHLAFQRLNGEVIDIPFSEMHPIIDEEPIENASPWLCFYNQKEGFAFGSIRIVYDNTSLMGDQSVLYHPHTQIGEWLKGVKYWNRRLIHDQLTFVPPGNRYREDNAYLVFKIDRDDPLKSIKYWADRLRNPLEVDVEYLK